MAGKIKIENTKLYKYAENWLIHTYGKINLNPMPKIKELLNEAVKEINNEK